MWFWDGFCSWMDLNGMCQCIFFRSFKVIDKIHKLPFVTLLKRLCAGHGMLSWSSSWYDTDLVLNASEWSVPMFFPHCRADKGCMLPVIPHPVETFVSSVRSLVPLCVVSSHTDSKQKQRTRLYYSLALFLVSECIRLTVVLDNAAVICFWWLQVFTLDEERV